MEIKFGTPIIYQGFSGPTRAVVLEVEPNGILADFETMDRFGKNTPDRIWLMRERVDSGRIQIDPDGPFAPLKLFRCTNKGCFFHCHDWTPTSQMQKHQTALPYCPQCRSPIEEIKPAPENTDTR